MRPLYEQLKRQHYSSNHTRAGFASGEQVFQKLATIIRRLSSNNRHTKIPVR